MSVGSKVVLLVSLGFIGLLIWYYGGSPEPVDPSASTTDPVDTQVASAVTVQTPSAQTGVAPPATPMPTPTRTAPW